MYLAGESNVPGAPGNFLAGSPGYFLPETDIQRRMQERYYQTPAGQKLIENTDKLKQKIKEGRFTPGFDAAFFPGSTTIAQAYPGGQAIGNAAALGGMMGGGPRFGPLPLNLDINAVDDRIESIGGSANIDLDKNQRLQIGGAFNPAMTDPMGMAVPQSYEVYGAYQTPGFGVNVNYRNTGNRGAGVPGGFPGQINAGFQGRF